MAANGADEQPNPRSVLLLRPTFPALDEAMSQRFHLLKCWESPVPRADFLAAHAGAVRALVIRGSGGAIKGELLASLPSLELIVTTSVGLDHIDMAECGRRGVAVANAGFVYTEDVAEYAVGLLIDVLRRISAGERFVRAGLWPIKGAYPLASKLSGKRVGIVGLGSIGSEIARKLEAFGCIVSYTSRSKKPSSSFTFYPTAGDLAAANDILVVCCAFTEETRHIINGDVMEALGKKGTIVNVGRGSLVDEKELVRRLMAGEIAGAGLDVFEDEPAVPSELLAMENVVLSPHSAVFTDKSLADLFDLVVGNLEAFFSGSPLISGVAVGGKEDEELS